MKNRKTKKSLFIQFMQSWKCHEFVRDCLVSVNESKPEKHFVKK